MEPEFASAADADADADAAAAVMTGEPSERDRAIRATLLGVVLGVVLAALGRRRPR